MWRRSRSRILTVTMLSRGPVSTEYIGLPSISPLHNCRVQATLGYSWASVQWCPIPVVLSWYISYTLALQMLRWSRSLRVQCWCFSGHPSQREHNWLAGQTPFFQIAFSFFLSLFPVARVEQQCITATVPLVRPPCGDGI